MEKMVVNNIPVGAALRLQFQTGVDGNGDPVFRNKNLSNIKTDALDQDVFEVAQALTGLAGIYPRGCAAH